MCTKLDCTFPASPNGHISDGQIESKTTKNSKHTFRTLNTKDISEILKHFSRNKDFKDVGTLQPVKIITYGKEWVKNKA